MNKRLLGRLKIASWVISTSYNKYLWSNLCEWKSIFPAMTLILTDNSVNVSKTGVIHPEFSDHSGNVIRKFTPLKGLLMVNFFEILKQLIGPASLVLLI